MSIPAKILSVIGAIIIGLVTPSIYAQDKIQIEKSSSTRTPAIEASAPAPPIAVDEAFLETYENYLWIVREIDRLERATGTVEIPTSIRELRERAEAKRQKLLAWMAGHKVPPTWSYDPGGRRFTAPAAAAKPEASKP